MGTISILIVVVAAGVAVVLRRYSTRNSRMGDKTRRLHPLLVAFLVLLLIAIVVVLATWLPGFMRRLGES